MDENWIDRVSKRAAELNISLEKLAKAAGLDRSYFRKSGERPKSAPRGNTLARLSSELGLSIEYILGIEPKKSHIPTARMENGSTVQVPEIDGYGGAGSASGEALESFHLVKNEYETRDAVKNEWGIPSAFLRHEARVPPASANILEVTGDSMIDQNNPNAAGTLMSGDRAIINTRDTTPSPPGTFALWDGFGIVFKMVEVVHGTDPVQLRLISKNPAYRPYEILLEEARIIGRVRGRITIY